MRSLTVVFPASMWAMMPMFRMGGGAAMRDELYLVNFQNRLIVFVRWGFSYLTYNRGARLITGEAGSAPVPQLPTPKKPEAVH